MGTVIFFPCRLYPRPPVIVSLALHVPRTVSPSPEESRFLCLGPLSARVSAFYQQMPSVLSHGPSISVAVAAALSPLARTALSTS